MKKLVLLLSSLAFVAGVSFATADEKPAAKAEKPAAKSAAAAKTHEVQAEFVSSDAEKKTVTLKVGAETNTAPLQGKAISQAKSLKAGEKVTATCKDSAEGKHEAVVAIKAAAAEKPAAKAPAKQ